MTNLISSITDVFTAIISWLVGAFEPVSSLFYNTTDGLTFMGTLAIMSLGVSVAFLIVGIVQRFLKFNA